MPRLLRCLCFGAALTLGALAMARAPAPPQGATAIHWQRQWRQSLFVEAAREQRFVLLDLHAVWCHWCHVMDEQTYADPQVIALIGKRYLAVSIDADSDPELAGRYGDWGWPATIVLAADGSEIVKRRGFLAPRQMADLLQAIIDDPTPGPSGVPRAVSLHGRASVAGARTGGATLHRP